jgi:hypothetical protein
MFEDNDNVYLIKKMENESNKFHFLKCKFLSNVIKSNSSQFKMDYYLKMANIYVNHKLYKCIYPDSTMKELNTLIF